MNRDLEEPKNPFLDCMMYDLDRSNMVTSEFVAVEWLDGMNLCLYLSNNINDYKIVIINIKPTVSKTIDFVKFFKTKELRRLFLTVQQIHIFHDKLRAVKFQSQTIPISTNKVGYFRFTEYDLDSTVGRVCVGQCLNLMEIDLSIRKGSRIRRGPVDIENSGIDLGEQTYLLRHFSKCTRNVISKLEGKMEGHHYED